MYVCMYVHIYACVCMHLCTSVCLLMSAFVCMSASLYVHMCAHMCTCKQEADRSKQAPGQVQAEGSRSRQRQAGRKQAGQAVYSHSYATVWTLIPKCATLLLESDEVPNCNDCVLRDMEVEELDAGKGAEGAELAWCAGEVVCHKEPICREDPKALSMGWVTGEVQHSSQTRPTPPGSEHAPKWAA